MERKIIIYPILLQETQTPLDLYAMVICVELAQSKQASDPPLLGKNIPKDHDGIFSPVLPTSIPEPPIDINLTLFPSGNCAMFSVFRDNESLFYLLELMGKSRFLTIIPIILVVRRCAPVRCQIYNWWESSLVRPSKSPVPNPWSAKG